MKSPVLKYCPPGSERGALGNQRPYLDITEVIFARSLRKTVTTP